MGSRPRGRGGGSLGVEVSRRPRWPRRGTYGVGRAGVLCRVRSLGRRARGGAQVTGLRSGSRGFRAGGGIRGTGSWSGSRSSSAGGGAWFPGTRVPGVSPLHGGSGAVPRLRGLDFGAPAATAALGAVETRLPDDALTLPNGAATHSSAACLPSPTARSPLLG